MSLTPHCLRDVNGKRALDIFVDDLVECHKTRRRSFLASLFGEDSLPGILISGGDESTWLFAKLHDPGLGRSILSVPFRRIYSAIMDSGVTCSNRHMNPLKTVMIRALIILLGFIFVLRRLKRR